MYLKTNIMIHVQDNNDLMTLLSNLKIERRPFRGQIQSSFRAVLKHEFSSFFNLMF
jgi:hypothetical protein